MELFNRRYLTIITFLFALTALLCCFISGAFKIAVAVFAVIFAIAFGIVFLKFKKDLFKALFSIFVCTAIGVSAFSSYFFILYSLSFFKSLFFFPRLFCAPDSPIYKP